MLLIPVIDREHGVYFGVDYMILIARISYNICAKPVDDTRDY